MSTLSKCLVAIIATTPLPALAQSGVCGPGAGDCCAANGTPGCDDNGSHCCAIVCACDPFCCDTAWDEGCATIGFRNTGCGAEILCAECLDADEDGVPDSFDVCCNTPTGLTVDDEGRPKGDLDDDCDVDIADYAILQTTLTGVMESQDGACPRSCIGVECDDGNPCTTDVCVNGVCTIVNNTDECDDCDLCTGGDACAEGTCGGTAIDGCCEIDTDCAEGKICTDNQCAGECDVAVQCDDDELCTDDSCVNNRCVNVPIDCNDAVACTDDTCDDVGNCTYVSNCAEGETCDFSGTGECEVACGSDNDCDDGVFCNGVEACAVGLFGGICHAGARPCVDNGGGACGDDGVTETCIEGDTFAVCEPCPSPPLEFTIASDDLTGTAGDDNFDAPLVFVPANGTQVATLQTGDKADGLAGNDTLNATFNAATTVVPTSLSGIETINITNFAAGTVTVGAFNVSGLDLVSQVGSLSDLVIAGLQEITDCGFKDINDTAVDLDVAFAEAATTSGTADSIFCTLDNAIVGDWNVNTAGTNGFESCTLVSNGLSDNRLISLTQTNGTTMATANFTGTADLIVNRLPNSILTYDALSMSGGLTLGSGTAPGSYATFATADLNSISGGSGDDLIIFNNTLTPSDAAEPTELIDLRDGADVIQASIGTTIGTQLPIRNTEELRLNATANSSVNLGGVTGLTDITMEEDGSIQTLTLLNVPGTPNLNYRGDNNQAGQTLDAVVYTSNQVTGTSDTLNISIGNRGTALNAVGTTNVFAIGNLTAANIENVTLTVADGPAILSGLTFAQATSYDFTASSNLHVGTCTGSATSVNAAGVTGNFGGTFTGLASGASVFLGNGGNLVSVAGSPGTTINIVGGTNHDTIIGSAQSDVISGGAGNDAITGSAGGDTIGLGAGADVYRFAAVTDSLNTALDTVTDFLSGQDKFDVGIPPTNLGSGTVGPDLNIAAVASTGTTAGTLATDIATVNAAANEDVWDQAGDTLVITLIGQSIGGTNAVYLVIEGGADPTAYNAAADLVVLLGGASSTTFALSDFQ